MMTVASISKAAPGWSPSPFQAPLLRPAARPMLAQAVVATPSTPPGTVIVNPPTTPPPFVDSAFVSAIVAGLGTVAWYTMTRAFYSAERYKTAIFTGTLTGLLGIKTLFDIWDLRVR